MIRLRPPLKVMLRSLWHAVSRCLVTALEEDVYQGKYLSAVSLNLCLKGRRALNLKSVTKSRRCHGRDLIPRALGNVWRTHDFEHDSAGNG